MQSNGALNKIVRGLFLALVSVMFSSFTFVLGGAPLFLLRHNEGRTTYLFITIALASALIASGLGVFAIPFLLNTILVLVFLEGLYLGSGLWTASAMSLSATSGVTLLGLAAWGKSQAVPVHTAIKQSLESVIQKVATMQPNVTVDVDSLMIQIPSAAIMLMTISLWVALIFGKRFSSELADARIQQIDLKKFAVPELLIWVFIAVLPGTFLSESGTTHNAIALNIFNLLTLLYFLSGLAVVASYFETHKIGTFWQGLGYFLFITQLFLLVSVLGLIDYWINFRAKLKTVEPIER